MSTIGRPSPRSWKPGSIGLEIYGKAGFVEQHAKIFRTIFAGTHITLSIGRIFFLRADVAVVNIDAALTNVRNLPPDAKLGNDGALHTKLQKVMTREGGTWCRAFIDVSYRNGGSS